MNKYNPQEIEKKWQKYWEDNKTFKTPEDATAENKYYILPQLPYPSGSGLHVGHAEGYTACDIFARYQRMTGKKVLQVIGWDSFGLPAENYAIKNNVHPKISTDNAIDNFRKQIKALGISVDWDREVGSHNSDYYKFTQWFFLLFYKRGLAYRKMQTVNWCDSCKTVLANDQVKEGHCERCDTLVIQKEMEQWYIKITDYAERLLQDIDKLDWPEETKKRQKDWIGKSSGAEVNFSIKDSNLKIRVFTTRPDTLFGVTYVVLAPEGKYIQDFKDKISNWSEVEKYIEATSKKTELERQIQKEKTGVDLQSIKAINPVTNEEIPIFVADYVIASYGTGAIMAVPAHDERDWEFAKKYSLPIKEVVAPNFVLTGKNAPQGGVETLNRRTVTCILENPKTNKFLVIKEKDNNVLVGGGVDEGETPEEAMIREVQEETGYTNVEIYKKLFDHLFCFHFRFGKNKNQMVDDVVYHVILNDETKIPSEVEIGKHGIMWVSKDELQNTITSENHKFMCEVFLKGDNCFSDYGVAINSDFLNGLTTEEAKEKMIEYLEENKLGERKVQYKLRDWSVSRQRFWGAPIPMLRNEETGELKPVEFKELPVLLPEDVDFKPTGQSPLIYSQTFQEGVEEKYGKGWKREVDTLDTFMCSSWYYYRYLDPKNENEFASPEALKRWMPVDFYLGGPEHVNGHLLYSRFFTKVLFDEGLIDFDEPFKVHRHQGLILGPDNRKMSKRWGNVINPTDVTEVYGADTLRMYEMFMGPLEEDKPWDENGVKGVRRFLERVWLYSTTVIHKITYELDEDNIIKELHKTIKKVGEDLSLLRFNTAIAKLMEFINFVAKDPRHFSKNDSEVRKDFLKLLSPFAPHMAEELWENFGNKNSISTEKWPEYDEAKIKEDTITVVVQVNGKVRDSLEVPVEISEEDIKVQVLALENVKKWLEGKEPKKVIYVKGRLVSIVV
ncbi:MAG: leucine--tRNA ligase [Candidatus Magasanikbacteria bacterium CG1_02_32_51]|uniref:Leucine--tRNA ligase n=1 Tax=Candidatus Magasanikbacteria bacterium CG1_02_32_51 TaxID=1805238 RepID=A0A1J4UD14_9BACT|nr:MAG: leucine--tRNA ligase [Candidatus Magasanikbacteria bacterium CG1_02_32_51]